MTELLAPRMMALQKESMKAQTKLRTQTLRLIASGFKQILVDERKEVLTAAEEITVIKKMVKQRVDSANQFKEANRIDLQEKELAEIAILNEFLPQQMNTEQMTSVVQDLIDTLDSPTMKQMGMIMGRLQSYKSEANMAEMNAIVRQLLA